MGTTVTSKGQVTIPLVVRRELGIDPHRTQHATEFPPEPPDVPRCRPA